MKIRLLCSLLLLCCSLVKAQHGEGIESITANPALIQKDATTKLSKSNSDTFDSTFIYLSDTLYLPLFDDFSSNKYQDYGANYTDPEVTSIKEYRLLDLSDIPLTINTLYTAQQTFRRTFDIGNGTFTDDNFTGTQIKVGDLSEYPVVYATTDVYPPYYIYDTLDYPNDPDTVWIPDAELFQDSATQFFAPLSDPGKYWLESETFLNNTMALDPWTFGVATFDGLDESGYPYAINSTTTNIADNLTSKPINLSSVSPSDSLYLSFLYQPQGLCDAPELGDSLILEFYDKNTDQWNHIWSTGGGGVQDFQVGHISITQAGYFSDAFQFRFKNWGGLSGSLDHFHLDYLMLRTLSGYQDTLFKDFAMTYPINSLLQNYTSVPWDHYVNSVINRMSNNAQVVIRNGDNVAANNSTPGELEIFYGGTSQGGFTLPGSALSNGDLNYGPRTTYYSYHDLSGGYQYSNTLPGPIEEFDILAKVSAQFPNFPGNDSIWSKQKFENYYAYDDGSAELAYGPTGNQARLAIQYTPYEADSLIGAYIHFVPTVTDVSNNLFLLTVWGDDNGEPGQILYEDDAFFPRSPAYEYDRNIFTEYYFEDTVKIPVDGTFYVGWRQLDPERLGVGLDMNIANNDKTFFSIDNAATWQTSLFEGSVMIRPIFSTAYDAFLGIESEDQDKIDLAVYPNPSQTGLFNLSQTIDYVVVDLFGQIITQERGNRINLTNSPSGVYYVRDMHSGWNSKIVKL